MKKTIAWSWAFALAGCSILAVGCDEGSENESGGGACGDFGGAEPVFEDGFDGDELDPSWIQANEEPAPFALTGDGELEIEGEDGGDESGAAFVNTELDPGSCYMVTTEFRTTQNDPYEDDVDILLFLNWDVDTDNGYGLVLTSDPIDGTRDYTMSIYIVTDGEPTELLTESVGGTTPQITGDRSYTLEGTYCDGCISFHLSDSEGDYSKTIELTDSTHGSGSVGFDGDLNIGSSGEQSIYFDYFAVVD